MAMKWYNDERGCFMKRIFAILALAVTAVGAGNVYICDYEYQADLNIFVVDYEYQADISVFVVDYEYQSEGEDALWYFVDYEYQSDIDIYYVDYEYQADLCVFFVEYEYQAGWNGGNKWQMRLH